MDRDSFEHRTAAIARAMAVRLNRPDWADLARLEEAPGLHPTTRCQITYLRQCRAALRSGRELYDIELRLIETMAGALEGFLGIQPPATSTFSERSRPAVLDHIIARSLPERQLQRKAV